MTKNTDKATMRAMQGQNLRKNWIAQARDAIAQDQSINDFVLHCHPENRNEARKAYKLAESRGVAWPTRLHKALRERDEARAHAEKLAEALRDLVNVAQRIGPPAITQGGLCEEQDWQTAVRKAVAAIVESEVQP